MECTSSVSLRAHRVHSIAVLCLHSHFLEMCLLLLLLFFLLSTEWLKNLVHKKYGCSAVFIISLWIIQAIIFVDYWQQHEEICNRKKTRFCAVYFYPHWNNNAHTHKTATYTAKSDIIRTNDRISTPLMKLNKMYRYFLNHEILEVTQSSNHLNVRNVYSFQSSFDN